MVYALDWATGKIVWEREAHRGVPAGSRHLKNTYASETPTTDGERVYVTFGNVGIFAYDFAGRLVWSQPLGPFPTRNGWGTAASPVLAQGPPLRRQRQRSAVVSHRARRADRQDGVARRSQGSTNWATPYIWEHAGRTEIITSATGNIRSYDLEGKLLWQLGPMSSIAIPTPFSKFGLLYVTSGYVGDQVRPVYAIKPGASGDISLAKGATSNDSIAWSLPQGGPYNPSPIVYGDYYYTLFDRGFFTCHDARTGKEIYTKVRLDPDGQRVHLVAVGVQRQAVRDERRRHDLRDPGGAGVQGARAERARRIHDGVAGDRSRQPDHPHGWFAVSNQQRVHTVT